MSFPKNSLTAGEVVERHLHQHWRTLLVPGIATILILSTIIAGWLIVPGGWWGRVLMFAMLAVVSPALVIFVMRPVIVWRSNHFVLTNERILLRHGVRRQEQRDIPLMRLNEVSINRTMLDRLCGCGTLVVGPPGDGQIQLERIPHVLKVQVLINELIQIRGHRRGADVPHVEQMINIAKGTSGQLEL